MSVKRRIIGTVLLIGFAVVAGNGFLPRECVAVAESAGASNGPSDDMAKGWAAYQKGEIEQAAFLWQRAAESFRDTGKTKEQIDTLILLAHAHQLLGQYKNSEKSLAAATILNERSGDKSQRAALLDARGALSMALGGRAKASQYLNEGLGVAREAGNRTLAASILNNLGNLAVVENRLRDGESAYLESAALAKETGILPLAAKAWINAAMASARSGDDKNSEKHLASGLSVIAELPASYDKVYALINTGLVYEELSLRPTGEHARLLKLAGHKLNEALESATAIGDRRSASYGLGYLARLYESERRYDEAFALTRRAIFAAQQINAPEALYRWEWQAGRLLKASGRFEAAVDAYRRAVRTLQGIRQELSAAYLTQRASFRDSIGPIYFELVDLLLQHPAVLANTVQTQDLLKEARNTVEIFKAAELRDYFRDDCVDQVLARRKDVDVVAPKSLIVYPIVLPDRLELLVSQAGGLKKYTVAVTAEELTREVREFRRKLEKRTTSEYLPHAQRLYDWIVRSLEADLNLAQADALVFIPDGALRTVPMAALHDGEKFLIAKYPTAITPGLDLTDPQPLRREKVNVLAVGLTQAVQGYPELPFVADELNSIQGLYGGEPLVDQNYVMPRVEKELKEKNFNVVHVASHGEFSSDVEKTFLLTYEDKLTMDRLDQYVGLFRFREDPLELLTLSACETAAGDDRAALGLAGIAVKAGARSALGSLWFVNDQSTAMLISEFYQQLKDPSVSRAVALQRAQLKLIADARYQHPGFWSPFLLINNWL